MSCLESEREIAVLLVYHFIGPYNKVHTSSFLVCHPLEWRHLTGTFTNLSVTNCYSPTVQLDTCNGVRVIEQENEESLELQLDLIKRVHIWHCLQHDSPHGSSPMDSEASLMEHLSWRETCLKESEAHLLS